MASKTKIPLKWIEGAGHNSNTDKPEMINSLLERRVLLEYFMMSNLKLFELKKLEDTRMKIG